MKTIASLAVVLAVVLALAAPVSADTDAFVGQIAPGSPQNHGVNLDGRGRLTWGNGSYPPLCLGLDFEVLFEQGIVVRQLGVWDDIVANGDGSTEQALLSPLVLGLWDTQTQTLLAPPIVTEPGTGDLRGDYRYFDLQAELVLDEGQLFTVTVQYGPGNLDSSGNSGRLDQALEPRPIFDSGQGVIANVGSGRYGIGPLFPTIPDTGPANRYHSGSFSFIPNPEPGTLVLIGGALAAAGVVRRRRRRKLAA
ncbi:MAG: PEP-CTERM sorting domain-containing protein [Planctomycetota bacterium]|jgi:hypothetical protein